MHSNQAFHQQEILRLSWLQIRYSIKIQQGDYTFIQGAISDMYQ